MALDSLTCACVDFNFDVQNSLNFCPNLFLRIPSSLCCGLRPQGFVSPPLAANLYVHWNFSGVRQVMVATHADPNTTTETSVKLQNPSGNLNSRTFLGPQNTSAKQPTIIPWL